MDERTFRNLVVCGKASLNGNVECGLLERKFKTNKRINYKTYIYPSRGPCCLQKNLQIQPQLFTHFDAH